MSPLTTGRDGTAAIRLGLFTSLLSALIAAAMLVLRVGLPTPLGAVALGPAIVGLATLGPALWANRRGLRAQVWLGPIVVLTLLAACLVAALGLVGQVLIWIAFAAALARGIVVLRRSADPKPGRRALWVLLLLAALLLAVFLIAGNKYVNFIADQLLLYGRTDGDVMFHGAIANAIRYFGFPSTGVDGLHFLRYHTGTDALTALLAAGSDIDAVMALVILQATILVPLAVFAIAWGAAVFGAALLPGRTLRPLGLATAAVIMVLLMQSGQVGHLVLLNTPMLLSGVLLALLAPSFVVELIERRAQARLALVLAVLALPVIAVAKVSAAMIWAALTGYLILRLIGPKRIVFWIVAVTMLLLFAGCFWLTSDPQAAGAVFLGTPFYVAAGSFTLPITVHLTLAIVVIALLRLREPPPRRALLIETLVMVALAANLPGLILDLPGGDAIFFLAALNWLMVPLVAMLIAALPDFLRTAQPRAGRIARVLCGLVLVAAIADGALRTDDRFYTAISGAALVHTGDLTYYADDKRRVWRNDTQRALSEYGLIGLYSLIPPEPAGADLAAALKDAKQSDPRASAYIPPQSDYWTFVKDCDGRSLWPMAAAGMPLIDGGVPVQAECRQEFAVTGYSVPEVRTPMTERELCRRAIEAGLPAVLLVDSLHDRSRDRRIACR